MEDEATTTPSAEPLDFREVEIDGAAGRIFAWDGGHERPTVLLIHGLAGSLRQWRHQLSFLWPRCRAVAVDLRGHGRSDSVPASAITVTDLAADVEAVVDALELAPVVVVGHSLGAAVALEWAAGAGERCAGAVLVDPNADSSSVPAAEVRALVDQVQDDPRTEFRFHYREFLLGSDPTTREMVLEDLEDTPAETLIGGLEAAMTYPSAAAVDRIDAPCRCLTSPLNDLPGSLPRLRPTLPTVHLPETSHWLMLDRADTVNEALADLLIEVGPRT